MKTESIYLQTNFDWCKMTPENVLHIFTKAEKEFSNYWCPKFFTSSFNYRRTQFDFENYFIECGFPSRERYFLIKMLDKYKPINGFTSKKERYEAILKVLEELKQEQ